MVGREGGIICFCWAWIQKVSSGDKISLVLIGIISFIFKKFMTSFWNSPAWSIAKKSKSGKNRLKQRKNK